MDRSDDISVLAHSSANEQQEINAKDHLKDHLEYIAQSVNQREQASKCCQALICINLFTKEEDLCFSFFGQTKT